MESGFCIYSDLSNNLRILPPC